MSNVIPFPTPTSPAAEGPEDGDDRIGEIVERTQRLAWQQLGRPLSSELAMKLARRIAAAASLRKEC